MIQKESICYIVDNSGGSLVKVFHIKKKGVLGCRVVCSVKRLRRLMETKLKKGKVERGIYVRSKKKNLRLDGSSIRFDKNGIALINSRNSPKAKRIYGPLPREVGRFKFFAISSAVL
jgi:large subunit ribosomal protein L14